MGTLLDAVNTCMIARSLTPVTDLESGHPKAVAAEAILEKHRETVQATKWWFNTEYEVQLLREADNTVNIPAGVHRIDEAQYTIANGKLYDIVNRTLTFDDDPDELTLVYKRSWSDLPMIPYRYIEALAVEEFVRPVESTFLTNRALADIDRLFKVMNHSNLDFHDPALETQNPMVLKWRSKMIVR